MCPFREFHLDHELRLHPDHVFFAHLRHLRNVAERRRVSPQRPQLLEQLLDFLAVEAGADVAGVHELAADVVAENE